MGAEHAHDHAPANFNQAFAIGIGLNLVFVGIEAFYGWTVDSLALLADAGHNLSDVAGLVLAWGGALASKLQPNPRHTYGWKKGSILAAFANALLLLLAMGALAWEAVGRLLTPAPMAGNEGVTIMVVAGVGIVINTATALLFMRGREHDLNIRAPSCTWPPMHWYRRGGCCRWIDALDGLGLARPGGQPVDRCGDRGGPGVCSGNPCICSLMEYRMKSTRRPCTTIWPGCRACNKCMTCISGPWIPRRRR